MSQQTPSASLGFRVHAGWATAVALGGPAASPLVLLRRRVELWDPKVPESAGPWHAAMENPGPAAAALVERGSRAVRSVSRHGLERLVRELGEQGHVVAGAGLVVSSDPDPTRCHGAHIHDFDLDSSGAINVYYKGLGYKGTWKSVNSHQPLAFTLDNGQALTLPPGLVWIDVTQ